MLRAVEEKLRAQALGVVGVRRTKTRGMLARTDRPAIRLTEAGRDDRHAHHPAFVTSPTYRLLIFAGLLAPLVLIVTVVSASALADGYSHRDQTISELAGPRTGYPFVLQGGFVAYGLLMHMLGAAVFRFTRFGIARFGLAALFGAYGTSVLGAGVFKDESFWRLPVGITAGQLHDYFALAAYGSALGMMVLLALIANRLPGWRVCALVSLVTALATGAFGLLFDLERSLGISGFYQRGFFGTINVWIAVLSFQLGRVSARRSLVPNRA